MPEAVNDDSATSADAILRNYFHAKDENRPEVLADVFSDTAALHVIDRAGAMSFPAVTDGREAIADVLVRRFNEAHENARSYYLARPTGTPSRFACNWLVGMSERATDNVRVGCGSYDWTFSHAPSYRAVRLVITIERMLILPSSARPDVLRWLSALDYPWTSEQCVARQAPAAVEPVIRFLVHATTE